MQISSLRARRRVQWDELHKCCLFSWTSVYRSDWQEAKLTWASILMHQRVFSFCTEKNLCILYSLMLAFWEFGFCLLWTLKRFTIQFGTKAVQHQSWQRILNVPAKTNWKHWLSSEIDEIVYEFGMNCKRWIEQCKVDVALWSNVAKNRRICFHELSLKTPSKILLSDQIQQRIQTIQVRKLLLPCPTGDSSSVSSRAF